MLYILKLLKRKIKNSKKNVNLNNSKFKINNFVIESFLRFLLIIIFEYKLLSSFRQRQFLYNFLKYL